MYVAFDGTETEETVGATASTNTEVVEPTLLRVKVASLETTSRTVPPLADSVPTAMPSLSDSLTCTV